MFKILFGINVENKSTGSMMTENIAAESSKLNSNPSKPGQKSNPNTTHAPASHGEVGQKSVPE